MEREELNDIFGTHDPQKGITNDLVIRFYKETFVRNVTHFNSAVWLWTWLGRSPESCTCLKAIRSKIVRIVGKASKLRGNRLEKFKLEEFHLPIETAAQPEPAPPTQPEPAPPAQPETAPPTQPEPAHLTQPEPAHLTQPEPAHLTQPEPAPPIQPEPAPPAQPEPAPPTQPEPALAIQENAENEIEMRPVLSIFMPESREDEPGPASSRIKRPSPKMKANMIHHLILKRQRQLNILEGKLEMAKEGMKQQGKINAHYNMANVKKREALGKETRKVMREERKKFQSVVRAQQEEIVSLKRRLEEKEESNKLLEMKNSKLKKRVAKLTVDKRKAQKRSVYLERRSKHLGNGGDGLVFDEVGSSGLSYIPTKEAGKFTRDARLCIMELASLEVATGKVAPVMKAVATLCNSQLSSLPSRQVCQKIVDEGQALAKMYIREKVINEKGFGLHKDGTTRKKVKILDTSIQLESGEAFCLGWSSVSSETGRAIADEAVGKLEELKDEKDGDGMMADLATKIRYYMNDRAANEKKSNRFLDEWREEMMKEIQEEHSSSIHLFCSAHVLLGFHTYVLKEIKKLKEYESQEMKHPIVTILKDATDLFGPVGDNRGVRNQWEAFCRQQRITSFIKSFKDNRFNGLFEVSAQVFHHHQDFLNVLSSQKSLNFKQNRLNQSLQSPHLLLLLETLGLFFHHITGPFWTICISSKFSFQDFIPIIQTLQKSLEMYSANPYSFFDDDSFPIRLKFKPSSYKTKQNLTKNMKNGMQHLIVAVSTGLSQTLKNQMPDFLEGGKYSRNAGDLTNCSFAPLSNLMVERNFGYLDASQRRRPNSSLHHHTSVLLLKQTMPAIKDWCVKKEDKENRLVFWKNVGKRGKLLRITHREQDKKAIMESLPATLNASVEVPLPEVPLPEVPLPEVSLPDIPLLNAGSVTLMKDKMIIVACEDSWYPGAQTRKRKLSDSAALSPKEQKTKFSTPQPQKKGTPQSQKALKQKATPQGMNTPKQQTPQSVKGNKSPAGKNNSKSASKGGTPSTNGKKAKVNGKKIDDEDEIVLNLPKGSKSKLFAGQLQEDDDDDDVDNDEEDDEESPEDDEEEAKAVASPPKKKMKINDQSGSNNQKLTMIQGNKKGAKGKETTSPKVAKKTQPESGVDVIRKNDRDLRSLFVKNLPKDCTVKQLKALSKDIKQVRLRQKTSRHSKSKKKERTGFAYLEFDSEATLEKNVPSLKSSYIDGQQLFVDYCGDKSDHAFVKDRKKVEVEDHDPQKLYIAGLADEVTDADLRKLFPKAANVILPRRKKDSTIFGYAFIQFSSEQDAKLSHDKMQNHKLKGMTLIVLYAKKLRREEKTKINQEKKAKKEKAKKETKKDTAMDVDESDEDEEDNEEETESAALNVKSLKGKKNLPSNKEDDDDEDDEDDDDEEDDDEEDDDDDDDEDDDDEDDDDDDEDDDE